MTKKDITFKRNLDLLAQSLYNYCTVVSTNYDDNPDFSDSFAYITITITTEEDTYNPGPFRAPPVKAA